MIDLIETGKYRLTEIVDCILDLRAVERDLRRAGVKYGIATMNGGFVVLREPVTVSRHTGTDWEPKEETLTGDPFTGKEEIEIDGWAKPFKLHKVN